MSTTTNRASDRISRLKKSVFTEYSALAAKHNSVNLGQGVPNFDTEMFIKEAACKAIMDGHLQYTSPYGNPTFVKSIIDFYSPCFGRELAPANVVVTNGAQEAIYATCQALINPGEKGIVMEPFFDTYGPSIELAGGTPLYIQLEFCKDKGGFYLDESKLAKLFEQRPKVIFINNPHNPTGKVWTEDELQMIAKYAIQYDTIVLSDEIYDQMVYDEAKHVRIATLPGMWERTVTINSLSKTFNVTGWKTGYCIGPNDVIEAVQRAVEFMPFCVNHPLQVAGADILRQAQANGYFDRLRQRYTYSRDKLCDALRAGGLDPIVPKGAYFVITDVSHLTRDDSAWVKRMTVEAGVTAIPLSSTLYYNRPPQQLIRWAFCKVPDTFDTAAERLKKWHAKADPGLE